MARHKISTKGRSCTYTNVRGHPSWAKGSKKLFLEGFRDQFLTAHNRGHDVISTFYDNVTHCWFVRYGFDLFYNQDVDDPAEDGDVLEDSLCFDDINEDEVEKRVSNVKDIHKVSTQTFNRARKFFADFHVLRKLGSGTITYTTHEATILATACLNCFKPWSVLAGSALESRLQSMSIPKFTRKNISNLTSM